MIEISQYGLEIGLISVGITLLSSVVRHYTIDKEQLKEQKEKLKHHRDKMKEAQKNKDVKAMQKHQKDMMAVSMEQMQASFKPMMFTMIPIILIFSFMRSTYGVVGILYNVTIADALPTQADYSSVTVLPNGTYTSDTKTIIWDIPSIEGEASGILNASFKADGEIDYGPTDLSVEYTTHNGTKQKYELPKGLNNPESLITLKKSAYTLEGDRISYTLEYENKDSWKVASLLGYNLGWFGWYFICSILSSMIFNKIMHNT